MIIRNYLKDRWLLFIGWVFFDRNNLFHFMVINPN